MSHHVLTFASSEFIKVLCGTKSFAEVTITLTQLSKIIVTCGSLNKKKNNQEKVL